MAMKLESQRVDDTSLYCVFCEGADVSTAVANLRQEGRLAVLDALAAVVAKFPQEALDEHADSLALPLVLRLVNDPAPA
jgi:hypothetical protein